MTTLMTWQEICENPQLRDLPFKIEQDRYGRIVMSPTGFSHGKRQIEVGHLLRGLLPEWDVVSEVGIDTSEGVRVPDVSARHPGGPDWNEKFSMPAAPDICVEVTSASNSRSEMEEKRRLFAERGCREFWLCADDGKMVFYHAASGRILARSEICPEFPEKLRLG